ncbi:MAG: hypothetical protein HXY34_08070 [Candidatus Thorarchaeota archaeon]|nr:hypothetical protein [Candidatus Thorarchaeota archaeon]
MTGPHLLNDHLRERSCPTTDRRVVLSVLFLCTWLVSASFTSVLVANCEPCCQPAGDNERPLQTQPFQPSSYLTTRREAIVTYVKALQAPEGYFHGWLQAPPPFEPDGTLPDYSSLREAYETLKYINRTSSVDWTSSRGFVSGLIHNGLLNLTKTLGASVGTCLDALTFVPEIGLGSLIDVDANVQYVLGLQQPDGGFVWDYGDLGKRSELVATYFALDTLRIAGRLHDADLERAKAFLSACHNESAGWYSNVVGTKANIFVIPAGIMVADMLGVLDETSRDRTAQYLLEWWDPVRGCDITRDLRVTQRIAWSLELLDRKELIDSDKMAKWVLDLQKHMHGAFVGYPEADLDQERLACAVEATHILYMYNETYRLDEDFSVVEAPVWSIPQWWLDYICSEWGITQWGTITITPSRTSPGPFFPLPDLSAVVAGLPWVALAVVLATPAIWVFNRRRVELERRRQMRRARKHLGRGAAPEP